MRIYTVQYGVCSYSIVTMAISRIVSEVKRDTGQISRLFHTHLHNNPPPTWKNGCEYFRAVLFTTKPDLTILSGGVKL